MCNIHIIDYNTRTGVKEVMPGDELKQSGQGMPCPGRRGAPATQGSKSYYIISFTTRRRLTDV